MKRHGTIPSQQTEHSQALNELIEKPSKEAMERAVQTMPKKDHPSQQTEHNLRVVK